MIKTETTTEHIESKGGLVLAGKLAVKAGLNKIHSAAVKNAAAVIISLYGLMMEGKTDFESMKEKRGRGVFQGSVEPAVCLRERNGLAVSGGYGCGSGYDYWAIAGVQRYPDSQSSPARAVDRRPEVPSGRHRYISAGQLEDEEGRGEQDVSRI
jgi:hypothetical protein